MLSESDDALKVDDSRNDDESRSAEAFIQPEEKVEGFKKVESFRTFERHKEGWTVSELVIIATCRGGEFVPIGEININKCY